MKKQLTPIVCPTGSHSIQNDSPADTHKKTLSFGPPDSIAVRFLLPHKTWVRILAAVALAGVSSVLLPTKATAATISWGTAATISGDTDVNANGTPLYAYAGGGASTVNGVAFTAGSGFAAWGNVSFTSGFTGSSGTGYAVAASPFQDLSPAYTNMLRGGASGGSTAGTLTMNGLTPGHDYSVQIWVNDARAAGSGRTETITGSGVTLDYNNFDALGGVGQYSVGFFAADNTNQAFSLTPSASGVVQLNAISVRDIGLSSRTWLGSTDTSWGTPGNWTPAIIPILGDAIVFNNLSTANLSTVPDVSYTISTLTLSNAPSAVSIGGGNNITINSGINLVGAGQNLTFTAPLVLGANQTWSVTNNGVVFVSGGVSGSATLTIAGNGVVTFDSSATYTGNTIINSGKLALGSSGSFGGTPTIRIAGGAIFDVSGAPSYALAGGRLTNSSPGAVINGTSDCSSGTIAMLYDGVNPPFIQTNGTLTLSGSTVINVNNAGTVLGAGNHTIIAAATLGNAGLVAGTLPSVIITGNGTVGTASLAINGSGGLDLVVTAPDIWTGASDNTWMNGANWIPANEPIAADSILFNNLSTANLSLTQNDPSGGAVWGVSVINPTGPVTIGGPNSVQTYGGGLNLSAASQNLTVSAPLVINADQNWLVTNSRTLTISGTVSTISGGNVTINGGGKVVMGAAHVLDGLTTASPGAGDFTVGASGTLDLNGNSQVMNGLNGVTGGIVDNTGIGATTLLINSNTDNSTFSGVIQNSGGALALDVFAGRLTLNSSSNTYSGGTTFEAGSFLYFPSSTAKYGTGTVTFEPGANSYTSANTFTNALSLDSCYLRVGGGNLNVQNWSGPITIANGFQMSGDGGAGGVTLSGPIDIGTGGISITNTGGNGPTQGFNVSTTGDLLSGAMSGSGGITYYCLGASSRMTVRGANTYSGNTVVNGTGNGKLNVNGGGNPFSTGSVTLNAGAVIEAAPGNQTVTNALILNGAILESECQFNNFNTLTWAGPVTLTADSALFQQGTKNSTGTGDNQSSGVNISGPLNVNGFTLGCYGNFTFFGGHTLSGQVSGSGNIQVTNNALTVSGSNTFTGTFRAVGGQLIAGNTYAFQNSTLDLNAADAGTFNMNNRDLVIGAVTGSRNLSLGSGKVSIGNNNVTTLFTGTLTGSGTLTKVGSGTLSVSNNAYIGSVVVSSGTLVLAQPTLTNSALVAVSIAGGSFLKLDFDATNVVANLVLNGVGQPAGIYKAANSGGRITGIGAIQVVPPQVWLGTSSTSWNTAGNWANGIIPGAGSNAIFNASSAANLATVLNANFNLGLLQMANPSGPVSIAAGGANTLTLTNGIDMSKATQPLTITAPVGIGAAQTWNVASNITLAANGAVSGSAALTVTGGGTVSLGGTNTYSGATIVSAGTLIMAGQNATASVTISAATNAPKVLATTNGALGSGTVTIGGGTSVGSTLQVQGGITLNNAITLQARQTTTGATAVGIENVSGNNTLAGTIAALNTGGNQWVVQSDAGTLTLGTPGSTWISSATGARGPTFQGAGNFSVVGNIVNGAGTAQAFMTGAGTLTLSGANSYSSGFTLSSGTLNIQSATALGGSASVFTIAGASTIDTSAAGVTISANNTNAWNADFTFAGSGNLNLGSGPVTLSSNRQVTVSAKTLTVGGVISGPFPLTKTGAGTLTLSGASTYSGGTTISAGTLLVANPGGSGTGTGAVNINSGATLGGTGAISGLVTNGSGGILMPGVGGSGQLTLSGNVTLLSASTNTFVVNGSTGIASNSVALGGAVTYGGVLNIVTNGTFTAGQTFTLFSGAGATNASNFASIVGSPGSGKLFSFTNGVLTVLNNGPTGPARLTNNLSGNILGLSWPAGQGWRLQAQTNSLSVGLRTNWIYLTDGTASSTNITVDITKPTVFYRLAYP